MVPNISVFNSLTSLSEANEILQERLATLGERADLAELRYLACFRSFEA